MLQWIWIWECRYLCKILTLILLSIFLEVELWDHLVKLCLIFWGIVMASIYLFTLCFSSSSLCSQATLSVFLPFKYPKREDKISLESTCWAEHARQASGRPAFRWSLWSRTSIFGWVVSTLSVSRDKTTSEQWTVDITTFLKIRPYVGTPGNTSSQGKPQRELQTSEYLFPLGHNLLPFYRLVPWSVLIF